MSKEKILAAIRKNKPEGIDLPGIPVFPYQKEDLVLAFQNIVETGGGKVISLSKIEEVEPVLAKRFPHAKSFVSLVPGVAGNTGLGYFKNSHDLKDVDVTIIKARLGVVENGAVWVTEKECGNRVLPFITQHLVIVLSKEKIVHNMHRAYQEIDLRDSGFGVFIAGPSKTADIEQVLVTGAQGARSFLVLLV